jgi:hypothetical protein
MGGEGRARIPESGRTGSIGTQNPAGASWRDLRTREIAQRNATTSPHEFERGRASIPENSFSSHRNALDGRTGSGGQPIRVPPLERLPRRLPTQHAAGRPDNVAPNSGHLDGSGSVHTEGWSAPPCHHNAGFNVGFYFGIPGCHFACWHGGWGCESGYVFCGDSLYWYWLRPGCSPYFAPYYYYYWPSCYYLPSYYPSYSEVRVVNEYVDDGAYYPPLSDAAPPAKGLDSTALVGKGWDQFRARDYAAAAEDFRQAVLANPNDAWAKIAYAQSLFAIGDYADCAFLVRRALELQPDLPVLGEDPRSRYGEVEDHAEEMLALRTFLDRMPGEPAATLVLGWQSYFTGDLAVARESFAALKSLDSEDASAARFLERLGPAPAAGH